MVKFKRITVQDLADYNHFKLRQADIDELRAATGIENPLVALKVIMSYPFGWIEVAFVEETNEILTMFGLKIEMDCGMPWMIASPSILKHKMLLMRHSKKVIKRMLKQVPLLCNYVDTRNTVHLQWLKRMKFCFTGECFTIREVPFKFFYLTRKLYET
jgi:hypothetical protein